MRLPWKKAYHTLNRVLVSKSALQHNLDLFRKQLPQLAICPVLKSNAYGHGLIPVAQALDSKNCPFYVVDSLYEAYELKKAGIKTPVLILGYNFEENLHKGLPFHFTAHDLHSVEVLHKLKLPIHLEIDTGMNRMGFSWKNFSKDLEGLQKLKPKIEGVFTHLSSADDTKNDFTELQVSRFRSVLQALKEAGIQAKWIHVGNSAGGLKALAPEFNMMRLGLGLYGISPYDESDSFALNLAELTPALELRGTLIEIQTLEKGDRVGYGLHYTAEKPEVIGVISAGYYEGIPIALSNKGYVSINGVLCPMIGRVCMNHCMIQLEGVNTTVGTEVQIYSPEKTAQNSVGEQAKKAGTIPYELIVRLSESIRRQIQ